MTSMLNVSKDNGNEGYVLLNGENWPQDTIQMLNIPSELESNTIISDESMVIEEETDQNRLFEIQEIDPPESGQLTQDGTVSVEFIDSALNDCDNLELVASDDDSAGDEDEIDMDTIDGDMHYIILPKNVEPKTVVDLQLDSHTDYENNMKQKFKDFLKTCSPDVELCELIKQFIKALPNATPIYVLSQDKMPETLSPNNKYAILCAAKDCENAYYRDGGNWDSIEQKKNFFGFPPDEDRCKKWIKTLQRPKYLEKSIIEMQGYRICEDHFMLEDFTNEFKEDLLDTAVPSLLLNGVDVHDESIDPDSDTLDSNT